MEQLLFLQEDTRSRITKGLANYKKSPKARLTKEYLQSKLDSLEQTWMQFSETHAELCKTADLVRLKESNYMTNDVYDATEELYIDFKCLLKKALPVRMVDSEPQLPIGGDKSCFAKLPKIIIPKFSGNYNEWITFRDLFKSLVHNTNMDKAIKMQYLKGSLGGEAEQLVRNMNISAVNYDQCWATLYDRYNNKRFMCNTILKRLFGQRCSSSESASFLKEILDNTSECMGALTNLGIDVSTWDLLIIYMTALKLDPESRKQWELQSADLNDEELPTFKDFQEFLTKRFRALEFVGTGSNSKSKALKSFYVAEEANTSVTCKFCKEQHKLVHCKKFESEEVPALRVFVEKQRLCFNCLGDGHSAIQCRCRVSCRVCRRRHHTFLHLKGNVESKSAESNDLPAESSQSEKAPVVCFAAGVAPSSQVLLATALVKAETQNGDTRIVRALLDQGSQASFITTATAQLLGLKRTSVKGVISGVGGSPTVASKAMVRLNISSIREGFQNVKLSLEVYVLKSITTLLPSKKLVATDWICSLPLADPNYNTPSKIDLLLGAEVVGQIMREGMQKQGSLLAQNTSFGWILSGVAGSNSNKQATNLIAMHQVCFEEDNQLKKFWELEADSKANIKPILTEEEMRCEKFFAETTKRDQDGRYIVKLPFKTEDPDLKTENSKRIAEKRLKFLEAKLNKATEMKAKYTKVVEEYLQLGHMEKIPENEVKNTKGVYLPHFAVVRNDKETTQVRIVFDASCKGEDGVSLNDQMMVGPTLQPELRNLLMRWRLHRICLSADIIKMYRQVKVDAADVDFQRILWRDEQQVTSSTSSLVSQANHEAASKAEEFRLLRVTFGTASAPYLAVKVLQQVAHDEGSSYPAAAERVKQDFYMDDLLTGCEDIETAMQIYQEMNELLQKGGFKLQKWSSNREKLLERIKETGEGVGQEDGLKLKIDEVMKLLGLTWNRMNDAFQYTVTLPKLKEPVTKRIVISDISRLFDPLGWLAPSVIIAKVIIQKLWISGIEWDEKVPSKILEEWLTYRDELPDLSSLHILAGSKLLRRILSLNSMGFRMPPNWRTLRQSTLE